MITIYLEIIGKPATAGSKAAYVFKDKKTNKYRASMAPASKFTKPWMKLVAEEAKRQYDGPLLTGWVQYNMQFYFQRPKSHFGTGKNSHTLKKSAPGEHIQKPDCLKLGRAVEDALTGVIWKDDCQVAHINGISKEWCNGPSRVTIEITGEGEYNE
jgi:Holliday junction resolvase RusA-like endonuclease